MGCFLSHLLFPSPKGNTYIPILTGRAICIWWWCLQFFPRPHIRSRWRSWIRLHMTPRQHSLRCGPHVVHGKHILQSKNFEENRLIHLHNSCHQSKWIIPLSLFAFSRWSQTPWIPCHSATLGAIYEMERQGADTHTPLPFIRGWSFTACRSSPQNLLLGLYYVNLQILTLKIV